MEEKVIYPDLQALVELYKMDDLPVDQVIFQYYTVPGKTAWAHRDELRRQVELSRAYPGANTKKGQK